MPYEKRGKMPMSQPQSKPISAVTRQKENNLEELKATNL